MLYQPIVDLDDGRILLVEALVRWRHPTRGVIDAQTVLALAARLGVLDILEGWILDHSCASMAAVGRLAPGPSEVSVAVNIQPSRLSSPEIVRDVAAVSERTGLDPKRLVLEITEHTMFQDPASIRPQIEALRALGVRIALDDFGAGYSLHHLFMLRDLECLPLDIIKIDRSFVHRIFQDQQARSFTKAILDFGARMNVAIIAEGIEDREEEDLLKELGCRLGQGFRIRRPVPLAQLALAAGAGSEREPGTCFSFWPREEPLVERDLAIR